MSITVWHHFCGLLFTIFLANIMGRIGRVATFWQIVIFLPATFLHELSHLLVAFVTGGRPSGFSIIPHRMQCRRDDGTEVILWTLGSVTMRNAGIVSCFPTGMAPLLLNLAAYYCYRNWFSWFGEDLLHTLALYITVAMICSSSLPSLQDIRVAFSSFWSVVLYLVMLAAMIVSHNEILYMLQVLQAF